MTSKIFLTGMPGVGKTTCLVKTVESLKHHIPSLSLQGFYTQECRQNGHRIGFDIIEYQASGDPVVVPLARVDGDKHMPKVGKYSVRVDNVQNHMVRALQQQPPSHGISPCLTVMDEVGKMELLCKDFFPAVWNHLNQNTTTIGTLPMLKKPIRQVDRVLGREDVLVLIVTKKNRDQLTKDLTSYLGSVLQEEEGPPSVSLAPYLFQQQQNQQQSKKDNRQHQRQQTKSQIQSFDRHLTGDILSNPPASDNRPGNGGQNRRRPQHDSTTRNNNSPQVQSSPPKPCGPMVSSDVPPRVLLMGETASPLPEDPALAYSERSMWEVLSQVVLGRNSQENEYLHLKQSAFGYGIAVWDVLSNVHIRQKGGGQKSDDAPNDLHAFLCQHSSIQACCFIGTKTHQTFRKHHSSAITQHKYYRLGDGRTIDLVVLPSSSGSNRMPLSEKAGKWKTAFEKYGCGK